MKLFLSVLVFAFCVFAARSQEVVWEPCFRFSTANNTDAQMTSECANFTVPFDYSNPEGASFNLFVKRTLTTGATRALFIVSGSAGDSGVDAEGVIGTFQGATSVPYDIYHIDHRGTGRSFRIGCVGNAADGAGSCVDELRANYSSVLPHLTVSNAARDLERVISWVKANSSTPDVVIFASNYGTFLTNRLLTLFPNVVSAVVMQSIMAGPNRLSQLDMNMNATAKIYAAGCDADPVCSSFLGIPAFDKFISVFTQFSVSECTKFASFFGFTPDKVRPVLGAALLEPQARNGLFPLLYRLNRCTPDDQNRIFGAIQDLTTSPPFTVGPTPNPANSRLAYSKSLNNHIVMSELLFTAGANVSKSTLDTSSNTVPVAIYEPGKLAQTYTTWTLRYEQDQYATSYATTTVPVLMLNGQYDGITGVSWARLARSSGYTGSNQRLIEIPEAGHNVLTNSPTNNSAVPCGLQIVGSFLSQNTFDVNAVNTSCLNFITATDFAAARNTTRDYAFRLFNTYDVWGVTTPPTAALTPVVRSAPSAPRAPGTPTAGSVALVASLTFTVLVGLCALLFTSM